MSTERRAGLSALAELLGNNTDNNVLVPTGFVLMIIVKRKKYHLESHQASSGASSERTSQFNAGGQQKSRWNHSHSLG